MLILRRLQRLCKAGSCVASLRLRLSISVLRFFMRFDLTDLRLFINVHEAGTITAGALRSNMTLASASERIRGMEDTLDEALLLRDRRGVQLTPAGRTLLHHARLVLEQIDRMRGELNQYGQGIKGHVRLLCNTAALSEYLPEVLGAFLSAHPQVSIDLQERLSVDVADALRAGTCDIGVLAGSADLSGLETFLFRHDFLALVVPKAHALATRRAVSLADVADEDFVGLIEGSALQEYITRQARRESRELNYRIRLRDFDAICSLVGQGIGVSIIPRKAALRWGKSSGIKRLALTNAWASRDLLLAVRKDHVQPLYVKQLMHYALAQAPGAEKAVG